MKIVNSYIFRAVCALLIGLLLVSNPERMTGLLVQVIGGLFLISGLVSLINYRSSPYFLWWGWAVCCLEYFLASSRGCSLLI